MIVNGRIILREKQPDDALEDYAWETDPELAKLDAAPVMTIPYDVYLTDYTYELDHQYRNSRQFSVDTKDGKHIGNCSYYNIDRFRNETELGIMIGDRDYWNKGYGEEIINTLIQYIFEQTRIKRVYLKTLDWNLRAQACFKKCGFKQYGRLDRDGFSFILMEINQKAWQKKQKSEE